MAADDDEPAVPADVELVRVEVEDLTDAQFRSRWVDTDLWGTPLYFADALQRWPDRAAAAVSAVACAAPGGVVVSCGRGCDRTGFVAVLLLHLVGVGPAEIADDYALSAAQLRRAEPDLESWWRDTLTDHDTTIEQVIEDLVVEVDIEGMLRQGGLQDHDLHRLRSRLLDT